MTIKPNPLDSVKQNLMRNSELIKEYTKTILNKNSAQRLEFIESLYESYKSLMEEIDKRFSKEEDSDFLTEYAGRIKLCVKYLNNLEKDISTLKEKGKINHLQTIVSLSYLGAELKGMEYTLLMNPD